MAENGTVLIDQSTSRVTMMVGNRLSASITVEVFRDLQSPSELWTSSETQIGDFQ